MHHIHEKQQQIRDLKQDKHDARCAIIQFRAHLTSEKFHNDTTIQVQDVQNWLDTINAKLQ